MRVHLLNSLFFAAAIAQVFAESEIFLKKLSTSTSADVNELIVLDDDENPVTLNYNDSSLIEAEKRLIIGDLRKRVKFYLHSKASIGQKRLFLDDKETLRKSFFNTKLETKFITHGWMNSKNSRACTLIRDAFLREGDFNVIVIDWSRISKELYVSASLSVPHVGKYVGKMIDFLSNNGMNLNTTTLIGHSLGAHVVGLAGFYSKGKVNQVVGLDPALPLFQFKKAGSRISAEDANLVDIIHTSGGTLGFFDPIGKADFYPNGGKKQPGCSVDPGRACSHVRAYKLFAESLISDIGFVGRRCPNRTVDPAICNGEIGVMGGLIYSLPNDGSYYVPTRHKSPFAKGHLLS